MKRLEEREESGGEPGRGNNRLGKSHRIRQSEDFRRIVTTGTRISGGFFTLYALPNGGAYSRIGLSVSRRIGGATVRNRVKRLLREIFRKNRDRLVEPADIVIVVRRGIEHADYWALESAFRGVAERFAPGERSRERSGPAVGRLKGGRGRRR